MFNQKQARNDGQVDTMIGPNTVIHGDLHFSGGLYVEGRIVGKVVAREGQKAVLTLAEPGSIEGEVHAPVVVINGELLGDVHASDRVELASKARVQGNVHYRVVEMSAGAMLTGRLVHLGVDAAATQSPALSERTPIDRAEDAPVPV